MKLSRWKFILSYVLVLAAGVAIGACWTTVQMKRGFQEAQKPEFWVDSTVAFLKKDLNLTPEQLPQVRAVIAPGMHRIQATLGAAAVSSLAILNDMGDQLDKELTPEQRAKHQRLREGFDAWVKENWKLDPTKRTKN